MKKKKWVKRWRSWIAANPTLPGVWRRKEGGFLVRARPKDRRTGRIREVRITLPEVRDAGSAYQLLQVEIEKAKNGEVERRQVRSRFEDFAISLLERKVLVGEIKSAQTREFWASVLRCHLLPVFGPMFVDEIRRADLEAWKMDIARDIRDEKYSPHYANDWLAIMRVILGAAVAEYELTRNPILGLRNFDTSEHVPFTEEEPNSLTPDELPDFLATMRRLFPQHFGFVALGFGIGHRPSTLRPLRRGGPTPDVLWDEGGLLIRQSHTRGGEVMKTTKTRRHQRLLLPQELMDILVWHVTQLPPGPMGDSELLFPSRSGGYRSRSCLDKPFKVVREELGLKKKVTPKAMRRTFQDLARAAEVKDIVTRAVSGHATASMQRHYSTVRGEEIREGVGKVISLAGFKAAIGPTDEPSGVRSGVRAPKSETAE